LGGAGVGNRPEPGGGTCIRAAHRGGILGGQDERGDGRRPGTNPPPREPASAWIRLRVNPPPHEPATARARHRVNPPPREPATARARHRVNPPPRQPAAAREGPWSAEGRSSHWRRGAPWVSPKPVRVGATPRSAALQGASAPAGCARSMIVGLLGGRSCSAASDQVAPSPPSARLVDLVQALRSGGRRGGTLIGSPPGAALRTLEARRVVS
jgi:hypothetical protein